MVDQLKPTDSLASSSLQQSSLSSLSSSSSSSLPPLARPPIGAPPTAASTQSAVSYVEAAGASSSCESPREIVIGGKPGSVLAYSTSSPLGQSLGAEKVPVAVDSGKPCSPSFGTMKETAEIEVKLEPKSPLGFKYESSAVHEDISDDDVETIKPERDAEVKVEIKAEASLEADDGSDKKNIVEVKEEMTRKTEESKQEDCSVKTEMTDVENSASASNSSEMEVEKPEFGRKGEKIFILI